MLSLGGFARLHSGAGEWVCHLTAAVGEDVGCQLPKQQTAGLIQLAVDLTASFMLPKDFVKHLSCQIVKLCDWHLGGAGPCRWICCVHHFACPCNDHAPFLLLPANAVQLSCMPVFLTASSLSSGVLVLGKKSRSCANPRGTLVVKSW